MILPIYLSPKQHVDLIARLEQETNKSAIVQIALTAYYAGQDARDSQFNQLAVQITKLDGSIERLCGMIAAWLERGETND